jgi:hypothetical protein
MSTTPNACVTIRQCAGSLAVRRRKAEQLRRARWGRFETQWLAAPEIWIDLVHGRRPPRGIVLDMDSSVSPTHGEQEMSLWNGH